MLKNKIKIVYNFLKKIYYTPNLYSILKRCSKNQDIILIGSPLHGNIGDHAISIAEIELLKKTNKNIVEIPGEYYNNFKNKIYKKIKNNDIIVITGGGFLGTLWKNEEDMVRDIIKSFPNNKIIIMPQTVFFENSTYGNQELSISKQIFNKHKDLNIFLRDKRSFEFCKKEFYNAKSIQFVPDIVTFLNYQYPEQKRDGILFCLREDKEKVIPDDTINKLVEYFNNKNIAIKYTTTVINKRISLSKRNYFLNQKLEEFKTSKLVITDRLHGMIFAAITGTPCIAFDNLSGKVSGVYEWLNTLDYISVIKQDMLNFSIVDEKFKIKNTVYDNKLIKQQFNKILKVISGGENK